MAAWGGGGTFDGVDMGRSLSFALGIVGQCFDGRDKGVFECKESQSNIIN